MRSHWWKFLALAILLYAAMRSLLVPLNPCIVEVPTSSVVAGQASIDLIGYRTHFQDPELQVILMSEGVVAGDSLLFQMLAHTIEVVDSVHCKAHFAIPDTLPSGLLHAYVNTTRDGTLFLPNAVLVEAFTPGMPSAPLPLIEVVSDLPEVVGFPYQPLLFETIRNLCWHVPMWFTMFLLMLMAAVSSVRYLLSGKIDHDFRAKSAVDVGLVCCILGLVTGSVWARFTWGAWWVNDPQLNGAMVTFMMYVAYIVLRSSIDDPEKRARISGVYNIFAVVMLVVLLMILPRFTESLHPGKSGNPAFSKYDLDNTLRWVFYPAVIGWMMVCVWIYHLNLRMERLRERRRLTPPNTPRT